MNIDFAKSDGLVPVIVQDADTLQVLMLGYTNEQAWQITLETGNVTFWSRSRGELWIKGETSGNYLRLKEYYIDCDQDTLLVMVHPTGPACHRGTTTCFDETDPEGQVVQSPPKRFS
ncbi:MAG: phosphoribosyl-AMP cyclohydrolase HisI [Bacteroidetes bacterium HLUCCA01]|nr:MAG: phosphoribosyl-AMP cyclohydrolase HisI [Bacteroidetes bacterium HLUCCA01]